MMNVPHFRSIIRLTSTLASQNKRVASFLDSLVGTPGAAGERNAPSQPNAPKERPRRKPTEEGPRGESTGLSQE